MSEWFFKIIRVFKMLYTLVLYLFTLLSFLFNIFWLLCKIASSGIPWFTLVFIFICIASKFVKLRKPNEKLLLNLIGDSTESNLSIANRGGTYDCPENSLAALKEVSWMLKVFFLSERMCAKNRPYL